MAMQAIMKVSPKNASESVKLVKVNQLPIMELGASGLSVKNSFGSGTFCFANERAVLFTEYNLLLWHSRAKLDKKKMIPIVQTKPALQLSHLTVRNRRYLELTS